MNQLRKRYGNWALVAGAAMGIGKSYCFELAKQGFNLYMIDILSEQLKLLSEKIDEDYKVKTIPICIDLFEPDSVSQIMGKTEDTEIRLLIYNAAFSQIMKFETCTTNDLNHYININVGTPLKLVHAFSNRLITKNLSGGILLMSSLAGLLGMQYIAPYAASKAFTWNLAESLHHELKPYRIDVMACIAGATATEAYLGTNPKYGFIKPQVQQPSEVVKQAFQKLGKKALFIPGLSNRLNYFILTRVLPRKLASLLANKTMQKMYSMNVSD